MLTAHERVAVERPIDGNLLTMLFVHRLRAGGALLDDLKKAGFDPKNPQPTYSENVYLAAMRAARRHLYPDLTEEAGLRELGRQFAEGYLHTVVGRVIGASLPLIGPNRAISRIPMYAAFGAKYFTAESHLLEERHWQVTFRGVAKAMSTYTAGWIEAGVKRTGIDPTVTVVPGGAEDFAIDIRW